VSGYRLVEVGGGRMGANTFPKVYETVVEACDVAETILDALADTPHRCPHTIQVVDVWTRETVTRVSRRVERDRDVCPVCGAPTDPFGGDV